MWLNILRVKFWKHWAYPPSAASRFFQTNLRKILDLLQLFANAVFFGPENLDFAGLTRKILQKIDLAQRLTFDLDLGPEPAAVRSVSLFLRSQLSKF